MERAMNEPINVAPINVALIYGSTRQGRFCDVVGRWAAGRIEARPDMALDLVDPAAFDLPAHHGEESPGLDELRRRIERADAFVLVTPEYNHGYPAILKHVIDSTGGGWRAKPVAFVSYGAMSGGLRAVEQLRQVFVEMHATTLRDGVSFHRAWAQFDDAGRLKDEAGGAAAADAMLDQLSWWALALRDARARRPYGRKAA